MGRLGKTFFDYKKYSASGSGSNEKIIVIVTELEAGFMLKRYTSLNEIEAGFM